MMFANLSSDGAVIGGVLSKKMPLRNRLLAAIPTNEYEQLLSKMEEVDMRFGTNIYEIGEQIEQVYFPNSGVVSLLTVIDGQSTLDVGIVGRDGMIGVSAFLGARSSAGRAIVLVDGTAMKVAASDLAEVCDTTSILNRVVMRFIWSLSVQVSISAACYCYHPIEQRLARFLLMVGDRTGSDELHMTQEFMSKLLGVRREGISRAVTALRKKALFSYDSGHIKIMDRPGVETAACDCYKLIREEEERSGLLF